MQFRTEIEIPKYEELINLGDNILTIGSCFADNISRNFKKYLFSNLANPYGVLYNPASIFNSLNLCQFAWEELDFENQLIDNQQEWHSFFHNSDFSHHKKEIVLEAIKLQLEVTSDYLKNTDWAIITLGTSFVFHHRQKDFVVSNCHKLPQKEFNRFMLSADESYEKLIHILGLLKHYNPNIKIILTVSPVRHWKDGAIDNQISKSALILAVNKLTNENSDVFYFPSYELMMDDLRDYRFYAGDLLHPNEIAVEYIWNKFINSFLNERAINFINEFDPIWKAKNHNPRNPGSPVHLKFIENIKEKLNSIREKYNEVDFNNFGI